MESGILAEHRGGNYGKNFIRESEAIDYGNSV